MSKYNNKKTIEIINGEPIKFDSIAEAERAKLLVLIEKNRSISNLEFQPKFIIHDSFKIGKKKFSAINYIADFRYIMDGKTIVEDVKGVKTSIYQLKKKMFLKRYGSELEFYEVFFKNKSFVVKKIG